MQSFILLLAFVAFAVAKTDLNGCVSSEYVINFGAYYSWWVPGTCEICTLIDCGGGRAPPNTSKPGCPQYTGTSTYTPDYMPATFTPCPGPGSGSASVASTTRAATLATTTHSSALITGSQTTSGAAQTNTIASSSPSGVQSNSGGVDSSSGSSSLLTSTALGASNGTTTSGSPASSTSSAVSSVKGNSGASRSPHGLGQGIVGIFAAAFAFLL